jgi:aryl-alcohol dehydrogenase-like predicted oxidoreductase
MLVATKGGHYRHGDAFPIDGRPETIIRHCEMSLHALDVESIWLYQLHWPDPRVPLAETMGAFAELQAAGKICAIGLSNVTVAQLDEATGVVDVASVQNRFSPWHQESADVLDACSSRKIPFLAYQPFGGPEEAKQLSKRSRKLNAIARSHGVTCHQVVVAWLRARSGGLVPIVGATTPASIIDAANAAKLELTLDEIAILADEFG